MKPITVIYINDDQVEADIATIHLRKQNINVLHIANPSPEGLRVLETPEYQKAKAVLLDMRLAGYNGLAIAEALRTAGDDRPFFLVTAGEKPNTDQLSQVNMTYIKIPVDFAELARLVRTATTS